MARKTYNKLVRDRIPEIIRSRGGQCETEELSESQYRRMLLEKIVEEAQELATAAPDEMINELADLYEVIESILSAYGIKQQAVLDAQTSRRKERGGFNSRVRLVWVE